MPFPPVFVMRVAAADRDRTGEHVTIVDVPTFLAGIGRSAAGEFGHSSSNCGIEGVGKPSYSLGLKIRAESVRGGTRGPPEAMPGHDQLIFKKRRASAESGESGLVRGDRMSADDIRGPAQGALLPRTCGAFFTHFFWKL
jgi:hypothetical protein